jgi:catechol 2,3-dioxygenase-like lactoylglutathione lyase family enzyme
MKYSLRLVCSLFLLPVSILAQKSPARPKITGISHLAVYATDGLKTADYYQRIVGCEKAADFEDHPGTRYLINYSQYVEVMPLPASAGNDRLDHIAFRTSDVEAMRRYLQSKGVPTENQISVSKDGSKTKWIEVKDFEGNHVQFVQDSKPSGPPFNDPKLVGHHVIHIGMAIRDRSTADQFYRDILGFRPYWHGGMDPSKTDWVAMQVPDGTDWLEYMLTSGPSGSGIPTDISQKALGVLNHLSIGVPNMATAVATLKSENRITPAHSGPQIGKDGKWQFNDFDPDGTRLEYMEFAPVQKPCCSDFTAPHPSPEGQ